MEIFDHEVDRMRPELSAEEKAKWKPRCTGTDGCLWDGSGWFNKIVSQGIDISCVARVQRYNIQG